MPSHHKQLENCKKKTKTKTIFFQTTRQQEAQGYDPLVKKTRQMSDTLLPGGTFRSRVQEGDLLKVNYGSLVEETEIRFGEDKRGWSLKGRIPESQELGREKGPKICTEIP